MSNALLIPVTHVSCAQITASGEEVKYVGILIIKYKILLSDQKTRLYGDEIRGYARKSLLPRTKKVPPWKITSQRSKTSVFKITLSGARLMYPTLQKMHPIK